jgi:hypothetical protein
MKHYLKILLKMNLQKVVPIVAVAAVVQQVMTLLQAKQLKKMV